MRREAPVLAGPHRHPTSGVGQAADLNKKTMRRQRQAIPRTDQPVAVAGKAMRRRAGEG
jgi:hypothetical protein